MSDQRKTYSTFFLFLCFLPGGDVDVKDETLMGNFVWHKNVTMSLVMMCDTYTLLSTSGVYWTM